MIKLFWGVIIIDYKTAWNYIKNRTGYFLWRLLEYDERYAYATEIKNLLDKISKQDEIIDLLKKRNESKSKLKAKIKHLENSLSEINTRPDEEDVNRLYQATYREMESSIILLQSELDKQRNINDELKRE
jgi:hypothetical protein